MSLIGLTLGIFQAQSIQAQTFDLTIFHNNDGESALLADEDEGGIANFVGLLENLREATDNPSITLSSGDNVLAGLSFEASQEDDFLYDAAALSEIGYDAIALGNHEFDFGPDFLATFIEEYSNQGGTAPFLSANLEFDGSPLEPLVAESPVTSPVTEPTVAESAIINRDGEQIGVVAAITPTLPSSSSPQSVGVIEDVQAEAQQEIDALEEQGINKVILISHLQGIDTELDLIPELSGVDVVIAGGGDELLVDEEDLETNVLPSDQENIADGSSSRFGDYPVTATNADGATVPVVTTPGEYGYLGRLEVVFNDAGEVTEFGGEPIRVLAEDPNVEPDQEIVANIVDPLEVAVADLEQEIVGTTNVFLNGVRESVRTEETNLGDLIADSLLWQAQEEASAFGAPIPAIGLQNGGGIRNSNTFDEGEEISVAETIDVLPFPNFVGIVEDVTPEQLKAVFENAYGGIEDVSGAFAQVSGVRVGINVEAEPGSRVVSVILDDGTEIVMNGQLVAGAPTVALATIDFLAGGGDDYPLADNPFTPVGVSYQQALRNYIEDELGGVIPAELYPTDPEEGDLAGGNARIFDAEAVVDENVPEPATILGLLTFGVLGSAVRRRKA
ncbi:MAG: 5'-nucleotidase C-terminal domain-containing protein [Cyanophyceae cyanobacterium]